MSLSIETHKIQSDLAKYVRSGKITEIKGARQDKLHHYRRLVYNVVYDTLRQAYPISFKLLDIEVWKSLVQDFFNEHNSQEAQIWRMPYGLYEYVLNSNYSKKIGVDYLSDLLYFEWVEIEVFGMKDVEVEDFNEEGDLFANKLVLNPYINLSHFTYPVHKKNALESNPELGDYFILSYRNYFTDKVSLIEISPLFALLLESIQENPNDIKKSILKISEQLNIEDEQTLIQHCLPFLNDLLTKGIILGFAN